MSKFISHYASEMDDTFVQRCIFCGAVIRDYSGEGWVSKDGSAPKGFAAGRVYIRQGNPTVTQIAEPEQYTFCTQTPTP